MELKNVELTSDCEERPSDKSCDCRNMMVLRVHGDDLMFGGSGGVITHSPRIPQMEMMKVHIPFTFKLHESFKSTYAGESLFCFT